MSDIDIVLQALKRSYLFQVNCELTEVESKMLLDLIDGLRFAVNEQPELEARVTELEAERRWIPVSERLPKRGQPVLVLTKGEGIMIDKLVPDMPTPDGVMWWMNNLSYFVTHWMSLPEPLEDK
jgi:hypothetical protein